jgi:DNA-binding transcriptional ArsR family regulator
MRVLMNPTRIGILKVLYKTATGVCFSELEHQLELNPNTLTHHLQKLSQAKLVENFYLRDHGREWSYYKLTDRGRQFLQTWGYLIDLD